MHTRHHNIYWEQSPQTINEHQGPPRDLTSEPNEWPYDAFVTVGPRGHDGEYGRCNLERKTPGHYEISAEIF